MLQHIEYCGRTCYKSEDKITEDSCYRFVNMLREHAHGAMLEHGTVYLTIPLPHSIESTLDPISEDCKRMKAINNLSANKYTKAVCYGLNYYITTNYRVIVENGWEDIMQEFQSECTEYHYKRRGKIEFPEEKGMKKRCKNGLIGIILLIVFACFLQLFVILYMPFY